MHYVQALNYETIITATALIAVQYKYSFKQKWQ